MKKKFFVFIVGIMLFPQIASSSTPALEMRTFSPAGRINEIINKVDTPKRFIKSMWYHSWYAYVSEIWRERAYGYKSKKWWANNKYETTIFLTIGDMISDYVAGMGIYANNKDNIVRYNVGKKENDYTQDEINAWVLANLIKRVLSNKIEVQKTPKDLKDYMDSICNNLVESMISDQDVIKDNSDDTNKFKNLKMKLQKGIEDVHSYINALSMIKYLTNANNILLTKSHETTAPGVESENFDPNNKTLRGNEELRIFYGFIDKKYQKDSEYTPGGLYMMMSTKEVSGVKLNCYKDIYGLAGVRFNYLFDFLIDTERKRKQFIELIPINTSEEHTVLSNTIRENIQRFAPRNYVLMRPSYRYNENILSEKELKDEVDGIINLYNIGDHLQLACSKYVFYEIRKKSSLKDIYKEIDKYLTPSHELRYSQTQETQYEIYDLENILLRSLIGADNKKDVCMYFAQLGIEYLDKLNGKGYDQAKEYKDQTNKKIELAKKAINDDADRFYNSMKLSYEPIIVHIGNDNKLSIQDDDNAKILLRMAHSIKRYLDKGDKKELNQISASQDEIIKRLDKEVETRYNTAAKTKTFTKEELIRITNTINFKRFEAEEQQNLKGRIKNKYPQHSTVQMFTECINSIIDKISLGMINYQEVGNYEAFKEYIRNKLQETLISKIKELEDNKYGYTKLIAGYINDGLYGANDPNVEEKLRKLCKDGTVNKMIVELYNEAESEFYITNFRTQEEVKQKITTLICETIYKNPKLDVTNYNNLKKEVYYSMCCWIEDIL